MKIKNEISAGLEDYIESIYISQINDEVVKAINLAKKLNITRASVSEALSKLLSRNLIEYQNKKNIRLTTKGMDIASNVYNKHLILKNFFHNVLNISEEISEVNACQVEHIVSHEVIENICNFTSYCDKNKEFIEGFHELNK